MLQDKSEIAVSDTVLPPARKNWGPGEKRQYAVNMKAKGFSAVEIAQKLGVSPQRVHQYVYEGKKGKKGKRVKSATEPARHAGSLHRLALKVQRGTVEAMRLDMNDYFLDVLLLCREILREG